MAYTPIRKRIWELRPTEIIAVAVVLLLLGGYVYGANVGLRPSDSARAKLKLIQTGKAKRGSVVSFTAEELNAYAKSELPAIVPEGMRDLRLAFGEDSATGYALIDFLRLRHAQGSDTPWLIARLLEGERPVKVQARIESGSGRATIFLDRLEISGLAVTGSTLDFMIRTFLLPLYPEAKIGRPFDLQDGVERVRVTPSSAYVFLRK